MPPLEAAKVVASYLAIMEEIEKLSLEEMTRTLKTDGSTVDVILRCVSMLHTVAQI